MLLQTKGSLERLKTLVNDKGHEKLKFEIPWRDEVRHKYDFLNQMINAISQVWKKLVLSNLKAFSLIGSSIILNWLLRGTNSPPKIASVGFPSEIICLEIFCNAKYTILYTIHPSGVVFKGVLECQIRNSLSARKWVIISKI